MSKSFFPLPRSIRCKQCLGLGYRAEFDVSWTSIGSNNDCTRCETFGLEYPELIKWLSDPNNNPSALSIKNGVHANKPLDEVVEKWIFQQDPPINWAKIVSGSFEFED